MLTSCPDKVVQEDSSFISLYKGRMSGFGKYSRKKNKVITSVKRMAIFVFQH